MFVAVVAHSGAAMSESRAADVRCTWYVQQDLFLSTSWYEFHCHRIFLGA